MEETFGPVYLTMLNPLYSGQRKIFKPFFVEILPLKSIFTQYFRASGHFCAKIGSERQN